MSEQGPAGEEFVGEAEGREEDFSVPMWVWTVLAFVLLMAVVIVVIIWGGGKVETLPAPEGGGGAVTQPVGEPATQPG